MLFTQLHNSSEFLNSHIINPANIRTLDCTSHKLQENCFEGAPVSEFHLSLTKTKQTITLHMVRNVVQVIVLSPKEVGNAS